MDTLIVFILFFITLLLSIYNDISILYPLFLGLVFFIFLSLRRGYVFRDILSMIFSGSQKSLIVIKIFILIGMITAVWRACGTIPFIVYYGIVFMSAKYFILSITKINPCNNCTSGHIDIDIAAFRQRYKYYANCSYRTERSSKQNGYKTRKQES